MGEVRNRRTKKILTTKSISNSGYKQFQFKLFGTTNVYVHTMIATMFLPIPTDPKCVIDHIDRNKLHNAAYNLRWVSRSVNSKNVNEVFLAKAHNKSTGERNIYKVSHNTYIYYKLCFRSETFKHLSYHTTLEDAIKKKKEVLESKHALSSRVQNGGRNQEMGGGNIENGASPRVDNAWECGGTDATIVFQGGEIQYDDLIDKRKILDTLYAA